MHAAFDLLPDPAFCVARPSTILSGVNLAACTELGYPRDELLGSPLDRILSRDTLAALTFQLDGDATRHAPAVIQALQRRKDGTTASSLWHVSRAVLADREYWIAVARPIADSGDLALATAHDLGRLGHDPMTGLPDRRLFRRRLDRAFQRARERQDYRFAVCFLDLDGFKAINDRLGHAAGDRVLCDVACRLASCTRPGDMTARYGGDEFTVLVDDLHDADEAMLVANRILRQIETPLSLDGRAVQVSGSIGVAMSSTGGRQSAEQLLEEADRAMYRAKCRGPVQALLSEMDCSARPIKPR